MTQAMTTNDNSSTNMGVLPKIVRVLIFDTETTGLFPKCKNNIDEFPYITQLSYIIYNVETHQIETIYNNYINIPHHAVITEKAHQLTGITREICSEKGKPVIDVLIDLHDAYIRCDYIVAHNWSFDSEMIRTEWSRNEIALTQQKPNIHHIFNKDVDAILGVRHYCTMKNSQIIYKLSKYPRLTEIYQKLFNTIPDNLHNSLIDTLVCMRCYLAIKHNYTISNEVYANLLQLV